MITCETALAGIGRAVAVALDKGGAQVVALSRTGEDLEALKKEASKRRGSSCGRIVGMR